MGQLTTNLSSKSAFNNYLDFKEDRKSYFSYRLTVVKQIYWKRPVSVFYSLNVGNSFIVRNAEYCTSHSFIKKNMLEYTLQQNS